MARLGPLGAAPLAGERTYSVSELTGEIRDFLNEGFDRLWVSGEVQRARTSRNGHLYFELVEKGAGDRIVGKLDAVVWRSDHRRVRRRLAECDQQLVEGCEIRCYGRLDFYGPAGRLQLIVSEVDPLFTLGLLERRRRETLAALEAARLLDRNRRLPLASVPLRIGLVTSEGSAAFHDFLTGLGESGFAFEVLFVHAAVQGRGAEREVASALALLAGGVRGARVDCIALVRGGGSRSDLAAFDSRTVAEAIARCPLPVLTGLGHEIDRSIADVVCHLAFRTPTKVAEFLAARAAEAELRLLACEEALARLARETIRQARERAARLERLPQAVEVRLRAARLESADRARTLDLVSRRRLREARRTRRELARRLAIGGPRLVERHRQAPEHAARRLVDLARGRLRTAGAFLDGVGRLLTEVAPERVLERGYSITRDASGRILKSPGQVGTGDTITTRLAEGTLSSRVEES